MPGLLASLQSVLSGSGISGALDAQAGLLQQVTAGAEALVGGPEVLTEIEALLSGDGVPRFDTGPLAALGSGITSLPLPSDPSGPLAPLLEPLQQLSNLQAGFGSALAVLDVVRRVIELAFRRSVQGGDTLPFGLAAFGRQGLPATDFDLDEARRSVEQAVALLGEQPALDAARLVELVRRIGGAFDIHHKWPRIPGLSEAAEALQTIARWESASGSQIALDLARHTALAADVIALPRTRVVLPLVQAAERAASLDARLADAELFALLSRLRSSARASARAPAPSALDALERHVAGLEAAAAGLDLERGPLSKIAALPAELELALGRTIRALTPSADVSRLVRSPLSILAAIPPPEPGAFADVLASIEGIDLSALTDPLTRVRDAVQEAVSAVEDAREGVRDALVGLLSPVDDALAGLIGAAQLDTLPARLEALRQQLEGLVQDQMVGRLQPIQQGVSALVDDLSEAVAAFDPAELLAPIRSALDELAGLLSGDEVLGAIETVETALSDAVKAIEAFTLAPAADVVIDNFGAIEAKVREIDPALIPDSAKPLLRQAVDGVVNIDIQGEVGPPIIDGLRAALELGPGAIVGAIRDASDSLRASLEGFEPSQIVGDALQQPFDDLLGTLRGFRPSALLERVQAALSSLAAVVSADGILELLQPLDDAHRAAAELIESLRPSKLLAPVEEAIERAVAEVLRASGVDDVLDGVTSTLADINAWLGVAVDARDALEHIARVFESPGDGEAALQGLVDSAMARLESASVGGMQQALAATSAAAASIRGDVLLAEVAVAVRAAVDRVPPALGGADARRLAEVTRAFPLAALRALPGQPGRQRLVGLVERLLAVCGRLEAAQQPWSSAARLRDEVASLAPRLDAYHRLFRYEGEDIFASFTREIASASDLVPLVRPVLERDLRPALSLLFALLRALGPHVGVIARGFGEVLVGVQGKLAAITGDAGLGGIVQGVDVIADLLRDLDLTPISDPLDAVYGRIESAWSHLDPEALRPVLQGFADSIAEVLDLGNLVDAESTAALDATWQSLLADLEALSPRAIVASTLDPAFERALEPVQRILALPDQLQALVDAAAEHLPDDAVLQLGRVEVAFDAMLRALPLDGGGSVSGSASGSVSASLSVGN